MMAFCDDIRLGGSLSATGISGGTSINDSRIAVADWSGLFGHVGLNYQLVRVGGRPGALVANDGLGLERFHTLNLLITRWNETAVGAKTAATYGAQLWDNTDLLLDYLADPDGFYLEVDDPDGTTRFVKTYAIDPASIRQTEWRRITIPLRTPWPYWSAGGNESTDTISGADTMVVGGNVSVYDAVLEFSGNGTFQHTGLSWSIEVTGAAGAATVDLGARTVSDGRVIRNTREWGWFTVGNNAVTADVSVDVTWRSQWS